METIHVIKAGDETVLTGMEALTSLYDITGMGWLFKLAKLPLLSGAADIAYKMISKNRQAMGCGGGGGGGAEGEVGGGESNGCCEVTSREEPCCYVKGRSRNRGARALDSVERVTKRQAEHPGRVRQPTKHEQR